MFAKCETSGDISGVLKYRWAAARYSLFGALPPRYYVAALSFFLRNGRLILGAAKFNAPFPGIAPGAPGGIPVAPRKAPRWELRTFYFRPVLDWSPHRTFYPWFANFLFAPRGLLLASAPGKPPGAPVGNARGPGQSTRPPV